MEQALERAVDFYRQVCDAPAYARSVEDAYRDLWRKWCAEHINTP